MNRSYSVIVRSFLITLLLCLFVLVIPAHAQDDVLSPNNVDQIARLALIGETVDGRHGFIDHKA